MKYSLAPDTTSFRALVFIGDSTSTAGAGKTGLVYNTSGLTCYYVRPGSADAAVTLATQTVTGAYSSGGFVEIDATHMPGWYRLDIPDAALAAGVKVVGLCLQGATGAAPVNLEIQLGAEVQVYAAGIDAIHTRAIQTEAYSTKGNLPSIAQALLTIQQAILDFGIVNTTLTVRKVDGSTTAFQETLNSSTTPTDRTRN